MPKDSKIGRPVEAFQQETGQSESHKDFSSTLLLGPRAGQGFQSNLQAPTFHSGGQHSFGRLGSELALGRVLGHAINEVLPLQTSCHMIHCAVNVDSRPKPDSISYNTAMSACLRANRWEFVSELCAQMQRRQGGKSRSSGRSGSSG